MNFWLKLNIQKKKKKLLTITLPKYLAIHSVSEKESGKSYCNEKTTLL